MHYALTLNEWRRHFLERLAEVRRMGFDERFVRMWDYYLAYCEGAFRERYISDVQLVLDKLDGSNQAYQRGKESADYAPKLKFVHATQ